MMDMDQFQWLIDFLVKSLVVTKAQELILMQFLMTKNKQQNYTDQLLEKLKGKLNVNYIHCLTTRDMQIGI